MDIKVVTRTGCQYKINEAEKSVTGGYFGNDTVKYNKAVFHGLGEQMLFITGNKRILTAPVKSVTSREPQMSF